MNWKGVKCKNTQRDMEMPLNENVDFDNDRNTFESLINNLVKFSTKYLNKHIRKSKAIWILRGYSDEVPIHSLFS